jgi:signal transduction histidine kinase
LHDASSKRLKFRHVLPEEVIDKLPVTDIADDYGMAGAAFQKRETIIREFEATSTRSEFEKSTGVVLSCMVSVPLMMEDEEPIGVVQLINKTKGCFDQSDASVLDIVAAVSTLAYHNFRLTEESARASTLLGMGKVSHDIGNLAASLHATMSFSDLALNGLRDHLKQHKGDEMAAMYVESLEGLTDDLKSSVDRIVGYSRLVSDLSAGRQLRPAKKLAPLADTIETSAAYLETEGRKNHVALRYDIQRDAPPLFHDELYLFRIVQNLVGNAIKAVKETIPDDWQRAVDTGEEGILGEVLVRYRFDGDNHIVEVQDSGAGMTPETAERILNGSARSEWDKGGGSGWGTKIVLELAATHNAVVSIDSQLGRGSTFRVTFPQCESALEDAAVASLSASS